MRSALAEQGILNDGTIRYVDSGKGELGLTAGHGCETTCGLSGQAVRP